MTKAIQIKITKEDIHSAITKFLNQRINLIWKKKRLDQQIAIELDETVVQFISVDYEARIKKLEEAVYGKKRNR